MHDSSDSQKKDRKDDSARDQDGDIVMTDSRLDIDNAMPKTSPLNSSHVIHKKRKPGLADALDRGDGDRGKRRKRNAGIREARHRGDPTSLGNESMMEVMQD
ncbi:hypothetical protein NCC49_002491 [Naganishia albida]|nr:hypothetical protein NCC49_002491 [Naganishia albida]